MKASVCALQGIGSSLTALPLVSALYSLGYKVDVRVSANRGTRFLFEKHPHVTRVIEAGWKLSDYDVLCCTHPCHNYHDPNPTGCVIHSELMMINPGTSTNFELKSTLARYYRHEIDLNLDLAQKLGYKGPVTGMIIPVQPVPMESDKKFVALGVGFWGEACHPEKHWGSENYVQLARQLLENGFTPVLIGDSQDFKERAKKIVEEVPGVINFAGQLNIKETFFVLSKCRAYVGNDTLFVTACSGLKVTCLSLVFVDAPSSARKSYPYPNGTCIAGYRKDLTPTVVFDFFQKLIKEGPWSRIQPVSRDWRISSTFPDSKLHSIRRGYGFKRPKVSVVILVCDFNSQSLLRYSLECIRRVQKHTPKDAEIIIVANAPSRRLQHCIRQFERQDSRVVSIVVGRNVGVVAKNFGYNLAQGDFIFSIDSDVFVQKGWIEKFLSVMEKHPQVGIAGPCGGRLRMDWWTAESWGCGAFPDKPSKRTVFGYEKPEFFGKQTATGVDGTFIDVAPSLCWCIRRAVLPQVGLLDWRFGPFVGSDADLCFRAKRAGWKVCIARVPIRHAAGGGHSHEKLSSLFDIRINHSKALYDKWWPQREKVCIYGKDSK